MSMLRARLQRLQGKASDEQKENNVQKENMQKVNDDVVGAQQVTPDLSVAGHPSPVGKVDSSASSISGLSSKVDSSSSNMNSKTGNEPNVERLLELADLPPDEPFAEQWSTLQVQQAHNEFGSFLLRSLRIRSNEAVGMHSFGEWEQASGFLNAFHPNQAANAEQFLFLDLETTGLGSGTGNVPFMVGLAYWKDNHFIVQQALIRHPAEERAMLAYVHHLTSSFTHLVTYNGKSFDWPLMHSRYVLNGMRKRIWEPLHIDLLHPSRAIWRNTLESCKLSHIEKMRLGIIRKDDLPGAEAPARYFQFLSNGDPQVLEDVFRHNEIDMLSLVTLAIRFGHLLSDRDITTIVQQPSEPEEMVRTGLWLERMNVSGYAEQLFELAAHIPRQRAATLLLLASRDKKIRHFERAVQLWQTIVQEDPLIVRREHVEAAIELSMFYEHKSKQPEQALIYAELAMERITNMTISNRRTEAHRKKELEQIKNRITRLKKKCNSSV